MQQQQQVMPIVQQPAPAANMMLPTGGIRTAFHTNPFTDVNQGAIQQQQLQQQQVQIQQQQVQIEQQQQQLGQHVQKKARIETQFNQFHQQAAVPSNVSTTGSGINEGIDPLTTFSTFGSMQMQQQQQVMPIVQQPAPAANMMLPTGGIRTAFHTNPFTDVNQGAIQQQQLQQQQVQIQQQQVQIEQQQQQLGQHVQKKARIETQFNQFHQQAAVPSNVSTTGSGITGRLGFNTSGGQLTMPTPVQPASVSMITAAQNNMQLPIGVGIRVGAVPTQGQAGGITLNHVQYGANNNVAQPTGNNQNQLWTASTTGGLSDQAMAERRQRNREHAKRSRVRKKFLLESLQAEVRDLQKENNDLRMLVQAKIPQQAQKIISECCLKNPLFDDSTKSDKGVELDKSDFGLIASLTSGQQNFVLSDPRLPDNPIVYASEGFYQLTGYTREQVLGRNCRFLQGPDTDPKAVDVIRTAVANGTDATACILNYKADGTPFWNQFFVAALRDSDNCIVNYVSTLMLLITFLNDGFALSKSCSIHVTYDLVSC